MITSIDQLEEAKDKRYALSGMIRKGKLLLKKQMSKKSKDLSKINDLSMEVSKLSREKYAVDKEISEYEFAEHNKRVKFVSSRGRDLGSSLSYRDGFAYRRSIARGNLA